MKIAIVNNMVTPYTHKFYDELVRNGLDLEILSCTVQEPNRSWHKDYQATYPHKVIKGRSLRLSSARFAHFNPQVMSALGQIQPSTVVINGFYPTMLLAAFWAVLNRKRLVLTIDGWAETMPRTPYHAVARAFVLKACSAIITCSRKGSEFFTRSGFSRRIFVSPLVPAWRVSGPIPPFTERPIDVLWVSQINDDVKNAPFFLDVVRLIHAARPETTIRIVGDGPGAPRLIGTLKSEGIRHDYTRSIPSNLMSAEFTQAKLLLLPSLWEPWGLVCNESLQCGTPAIVSPHVGAAGELVLDRQSGRVLPLDPSAWSNEIINLLTNPAAWEHLSTGARAYDPAADFETSLANFREAVLC